jgi:hypothetical protein
MRLQRAVNSFGAVSREAETRLERTEKGYAVLTIP